MTGQGDVAGRLVETAARCERAEDALHCVTSDPRERAIADPRFLGVCDDLPVDILNSVHCPPGCGGHPICAPCMALSREIGLAR